MRHVFLSKRLAIVCHQSDTVPTPNGDRLKSEAKKQRTPHDENPKI